jgi:isoleucyl-tRNA synthetase
LSAFVTGKSPYKNVLVNDMLLDRYDKKTSESKGNDLDSFALMEEYGADAIRWYMPHVSPIWLPIKFDVEDLKDVYSKFISTLKKTYNFFAIYANTDDIDPRELISKVQNLRKTLDFDIVDRINIFCESDSEIKAAINKHKEFIMSETLALNIEEKKLDVEALDLNGYTIKISIEKSK